MKQAPDEKHVDTANSGPPDPLQQNSSSLDTELGQTKGLADVLTSASHPFYALSGIFWLFSAPENQFLNLMEDKVRVFSIDEIHGIKSIPMVKKQVDAHNDRLRDILDIIEERGGRSWNLRKAT